MLAENNIQYAYERCNGLAISESQNHRYGFFDGLTLVCAKWFYQ
jgi:hypothetical protein